MKVLDVSLGEFAVCFIDDIVDGTEMVCCFDDIVDIHGLVGNAEGVGLEYIACLVMCQTAALYVVGIVGEVYLYTMIYATLCLGGFLLF